MFYIYILYSSAADRYYVGHSSDPWNRLQQHLRNSGETYTGNYADWQLEAVFEVSVMKGEADKDTVRHLQCRTDIGGFANRCCSALPLRQQHKCGISNDR
jgi:hypothetical protein